MGSSSVRPGHWVVVMGVSASGKTTLGTLLAEALGVSFRDGDDLHPASNIRKMKSGTPLTDADRGPWLEDVRQVLHGEENGIVMACSALKEAYRETLRDGPRPVEFVFLAAEPALIRRRLRERNDHFMPPWLADSQFDALEPPDETAITLPADHPPEELVQRVLPLLRQH